METSRLSRVHVEVAESFIEITWASGAGCSTSSATSPDPRRSSKGSGRSGEQGCRSRRRAAVAAARNAGSLGRQRSPGRPRPSAYRAPTGMGCSRAGSGSTTAASASERPWCRRRAATCLFNSSCSPTSVRTGSRARRLLVLVLARFKGRDEKYVPAPADFRSRALSRFRESATAHPLRDEQRPLHPASVRCW